MKNKDKEFDRMYTAEEVFKIKEESYQKGYDEGRNAYYDYKAGVEEDKGKV